MYHGSQRGPSRYHRQALQGQMIHGQGVQGQQVTNMDAMKRRAAKAQQMKAIQEEALMRRFGTTDVSQLPPWAMNAQTMQY